MKYQINNSIWISNNEWILEWFDRETERNVAVELLGDYHQILFLLEFIFTDMPIVGIRPK